MTVYKPIEAGGKLLAAILAVALGNSTDITSKDCEIGTERPQMTVPARSLLQDHTDRE